MNLMLSESRMPEVFSISGYRLTSCGAGAYACACSFTSSTLFRPAISNLRASKPALNSFLINSKSAAEL
jgi:hypothetical protein